MDVAGAVFIAATTLVPIVSGLVLAGVVVSMYRQVGRGK